MECLLFQPHPHKKKIPAECWRAKKNNLQANTRKKNFIVNQGVEKKFHDQTKSPTPPPPSEVEWSALNMFNGTKYYRNSKGIESHGDELGQNIGHPVFRISHKSLLLYRDLLLPSS